MGKYFEELNLTECNDALMGVIYYSIRLAQRLIARATAAYMNMWEHLDINTCVLRTRRHTPTYPAISTQCEFVTDFCKLP